MNFLDAFDRVYSDLRRDKWLHYFTIFCRIALALGFLPAGIVKVRGERFTGLPSNHPLGHYFDALHLTGLYYTFLGVGQLLAAVLLIVPRTALLGAMLYFPIIVNICVLTYATRFEGTRIATLMLLANLFLLIWDYDRLRHACPFVGRPQSISSLTRTASSPPWFFFSSSRRQRQSSLSISFCMTFAPATPRRNARAETLLLPAFNSAIASTSTETPYRSA